MPMTGTPGEELLYPLLVPGTSGLANKSFALIDHLRPIDKRWGRRVFGELAVDEIAAIDEGSAVFRGLGDRLNGSGPPACFRSICGNYLKRKTGTQLRMLSCGCIYDKLGRSKPRRLSL
jgi:hypothetical protein